jgi:hypothetical protein
MPRMVEECGGNVSEAAKDDNLPEDAGQGG